MTCQLCDREFSGSCCYCGWKPKGNPAISAASGRSILSAKTGVRWILCAWSHGCQMPCATSSGGETLCRWHAHCARTADERRIWSNQDACAEWLEWMQSAYPSTGYWSLPVDRLWPVLTGNNMIVQGTA